MTCHPCLRNYGQLMLLAKGESASAGTQTMGDTHAPIDVLYHVTQHQEGLAGIKYCFKKRQRELMELGGESDEGEEGKELRVRQ